MIEILTKMCFAIGAGILSTIVAFGAFGVMTIGYNTIEALICKVKGLVKK